MKKEQINTVEFINKSGLLFEDISCEQWRKYFFSEAHCITIEDPIKLHVSTNGHRIFDSYGNSYYIPNTWICIKWRAKEGCANFVK